MRYMFIVNNSSQSGKTLEELNVLDLLQFIYKHTTTFRVA